MSAEHKPDPQGPVLHTRSNEHAPDSPTRSDEGVLDPSYQRRFGGLERLYGPDVLPRLAGAHMLVAGIGGVGTWSAEALARSGVGRITLVDLDHIAESNINRQLHALSDTLGQAKIDAMAQRIAGINPQCRVRGIDDFVSPENIASLLEDQPDVVIDCTDQPAAKIAMILAGRQRGIPVLVCGGAGGKTDPLALRAGDLSMANHDALLSRLRNRLRREYGYPKASSKAGKPVRRAPRMGVWALWFEQPTVLPQQWTNNADSADGLQGLSCAGYGSVVTVTATMGMAAAGRALDLLVANVPAGTAPSAK